MQNANQRQVPEVVPVFVCVTRRRLTVSLDQDGAPSGKQRQQGCFFSSAQQTQIYRLCQSAFCVCAGIERRKTKIILNPEICWVDKYILSLLCITAQGLRWVMCFNIASSLYWKALPSPSHPKGTQTNIGYMGLVSDAPPSEASVQTFYEKSFYIIHLPPKCLCFAAWLTNRTEKRYLNPVRSCQRHCMKVYSAY